MKNKLLLGIAAVTVAGGVFYLFREKKIESTDTIPTTTQTNIPTRHPLEGKYVKASGDNSIYKVVQGKPYGVRNPQEMDEMMLQEYGSATPWRYVTMLPVELAAHFPELKQSLGLSGVLKIN